VQTTFSGIGVSFDLDPLANDITKIKDNIEKIKNTFNSIGTVAQGLDTNVPLILTGFAGTINQFPDEVGKIVAVNLGAAQQAVQSFLAEAQKLLSALDQGGTFDVDASLKKFGETAFSAKGGMYKVTGKEVVINVNFKIAMDADDIQGAMAKKGVFKEKINAILGVLPGDDAAAKNARAVLATQQIG